MEKHQLLEAIKHYQVRNYKQAYTMFKKLAKHQTEAQYYLGLMFYHGYATTQDYDVAFKYFVQAWEGLYPNAIYMLGVCYELGRGVEKDLEKAFEYYQAAAKNRSLDATLKIAKFYEEGLCVEKSLKKAIELYVSLTKSNHAYAMYKIGVFYLKGIGLKKSLDNAYQWLNKALAAGSKEAMDYFRYLGSKSKNDMRTKEELYLQGLSYLRKDEIEHGILLLETASKEGHVAAILELSNMYQLGEVIVKDDEKSFKLLLKHKDLKAPELYHALATHYERGIGVPSSYIKAALFYELAAKEGHEAALESLESIRGYGI